MLHSDDDEEIPTYNPNSDSDSDSDWKIPESALQRTLKEMNNYLTGKGLPERTSVFPTANDNEALHQLFCFNVLKELQKLILNSPYTFYDSSSSGQLHHSNDKIDILMTPAEQPIISYANLMSFFELKKNIQTQNNEASPFFYVLKEKRKKKKEKKEEGRKKKEEGRKKKERR